jgi:predicted MFS family arabinose efflux permease
VTFPRGLRALNHPEFRRFYGAQLLAQIGGWMQTVAQSWLVLQLADSPFKLGLIGTLQFLPILLFSIVSGAVADRLPKRRVLISTQVALACQAVAVAVLIMTGRVRYWHVAMLAPVVGFANALDMPTRQSFIAELVGREDVVNAVALNSAAFNAARVVGPAIAGLLIAHAGLAPAFVINSMGFLVVIAALLTLESEGRPGPRRGTTMLEEINEGLAYAFETPRIKLFLGLLFAVSITVFNFTVYVPLLARNVLGLGAEGFGFLMAALGVGAVSGALTVGMLPGHHPPIPVMFGAAAIACGGLLSLSAVTQVPVAMALLLIIGYFGLVLVASCNTAMQITAPDAMRGRVMSLYTLVWGGVFPIGAFSVGSISEGWGVSRAFLVMGSVGLATVVVLRVWWTMAQRDAHAGSLVSGREMRGPGDRRERGPSIGG